MRVVTTTDLWITTCRERLEEALTCCKQGSSRRELLRELEAARSAARENLVEEMLSRLVRMASAHGSPQTVLPGLLSELQGILSVPESRAQIARGVLGIVESNGRAHTAPPIGVILGSSGSGKTFLWQQLVGEIHSRAGIVLYHKCPQSGEAPFSVALSLARRLSEVSTSYSEDRVARQAQRILDPEDLAVVTRVIEENFRDGARVDPASVSPALGRFLHGQLDEVEGRAPVVVALDDIQWIDPESLRCIVTAFQQTHVGVLLLWGRPEITLPRPAAIGFRASIPPLSEAEQDGIRRLFLSVFAPDSRPSRDFVLHVDATGNPLALVSRLRAMVQRIVSTGPDAPDSSNSYDSNVDESMKPLLQVTALLFPPIRTATLINALSPEMDHDTCERLVQDAVHTGVLTRGETNAEIAFAHDSLEESARKAALNSRASVASALSALPDLPNDSNQRVIQGLAELIVDKSRGAGDRLERKLAPDVIESIQAFLETAATRSVRYGRTEQAYRFSNAALEAEGNEADRARLSRLHALAHSAASRKNDAEAMSHHFRWLSAYAGATQLAHARSEWISLCYLHLRFRGALAVGKKLLSDLGAIRAVSLGTADHSSGSLSGLMYLRAQRLQPLIRRLSKLPHSENAQSALIRRCCVSLGMTAMTIDPPFVSTLAAVIVDQSLRFGWNALTPVGIAYWSCAELILSGDVKRRQKIARRAKELRSMLLREMPRDPERYAGWAAVSLYAGSWESLSRGAVPGLLAEYSRGLELGCYEEAMHLRHVAHELDFVGGRSLVNQGKSLEATRRRTLEFGLNRIHLALEKWQRATEALLHELGPNDWQSPREDDGNRSGSMEDELNTAGLDYVAVIMRSLELDDDAVIRACSQWSSHGHLLYIFADAGAVWLHAGLACFRSGRTDQLRVMRRKLRSFSNTPELKHRVRILGAAVALKTNANARSVRTSLSAVRDAVRADYLCEAAISAETFGDFCSRELADAASGKLFYSVAHSCYSRWGAGKHARRVADELSRIADEVDSSISLSEEREQISLQLLRTLLVTMSEAIVVYVNPKNVLAWSAAAEQYLESGVGVAGRSLRRDLASAAEELWSVNEYGAKVQVNRDNRATTVGRLATINLGSARRPALLVSINEKKPESSRTGELLEQHRRSTLSLLGFSVAHEIGNAAYASELFIKGLQKIHAERNSTDEKTAHLLSQLSVANRRITKLVREVSRTASSEPTQSTFSTGELLERLEHFARPLVEGRGHSLVTECPNDEASLTGDMSLLEQALLNLIKNAVEATRTPKYQVVLR